MKRWPETAAPGVKMIQVTQPMTYLCERCGRTVGQEILTCPYQLQAHCPFVKRDLVSRKSRLLAAGMFLFGALLFFWTKQQGDVFHMLLSLGLIGMGFVGACLTNTLLYNPKSRLRWKRTALLGITLERRWILAERLPPLDLSFSQPLLFPPSVTKLSEIAPHRKGWNIAQATDLLRAALVGLLARGVVQIQQYQEYIARGWGEFKRGQAVYVLTVAGEADSTSVEGALEQKVLSVLRSWATRKGEESLEWPDGPPIHQLIRAVYGKDVSSPPDWVFDLVTQDAIAQGWGRLEGWSRKHYVPSEAHEERLRLESAIINELSSQFARQQPALSQTLTDQIKEAILSRTAQTYDYYSG